VRVGFQKTQLDLAESQRLVVEARARLAGAIGVSLHALSRIKLSTAWPENATAIAELTTRKVQRAALRTRPDILSALAEYAASQSALQLEIARQYPDIHLQPGYEFDQGDSKWSLGFSVELPVLNQNQGPIAEARARREESAARFNALQTRVMVEIEGAIESFRIAETNYSALRGLAEVQQNRRDLVAAQVKSGAADQLDLLSAQLEFATAQLVQIDGEIRLQQAAASLEDAVQRPLAFSHEILFSSRGNAR
jgi:outer membrane protein TolC